MSDPQEETRRAPASMLDEFFRSLSGSLFQGLVQSLESGVRGWVGESLKRLAFSMIAVGIAIASSILLLIAAIEGLKQASVPPPVAYLITGLLGLASGFVLYRVKS